MNAPQAIIWGNVTRDPELRYTADNGTPWTTLRVATNTRRRNQEQETLFWEVTLWRHTAEYAVRNVRTGMGVYAQGDFSLRSYTRDDGTLVTVPCISSSDFEVATRGAPAAENWLQNRPPRTPDGGTPAEPAQVPVSPPATTQQQAQDNGRRRSGELEPRQHQPQSDHTRAQNRARPQAPTPTRSPQATPAAGDPPFDPPEEPAYTPQFYDED